MAFRHSSRGLLCALVLAAGCFSRAPAQGPADDGPTVLELAPVEPGIPIEGFWATWGRPLRRCLSEHRERAGGACRNRLAVTIEKSARRMTLTCDGEPVKGYFIALGRSPEGAKERRGDDRTPEGTYYLCERVPLSAFYRSLRISYPNAVDAARGLRQGLINAPTYDRIVWAIYRHRQPPQNTALGGDICIHGGGIGKVVAEGDKRYVHVNDWTGGCIAMRNEDVLELHQILNVGAPVIILR